MKPPLIQTRYGPAPPHLLGRLYAYVYVLVPGQPAGFGEKKYAPHILGNEVDGGACGFQNVLNKKLGSLWIPANGLLF